MAKSQKQKAEEFAALHREGIFVLANAWDIPSAAIAVEEGFKAIATTSATPHMPHTSGRGNCSRHTSARLRPVAMPSLAESDWMSIAIRFALTITQTSR